MADGMYTKPNVVPLKKIVFSKCEFAQIEILIKDLPRDLRGLNKVWARNKILPLILEPPKLINYGQ